MVRLVTKAIKPILCLLLTMLDMFAPLKVKNKFVIQLTVQILARLILIKKLFSINHEKKKNCPFCYFKIFYK
jgi:hypothetical protein